jgi:curved DNA-binding protein
MKFKDYYRIMGVAPEATAEDIKIAYRKLARKYHPDVSKEPGTLERFTDLGEANEVLKDPQRRAAYDQLRAGGLRDGQEMDAPPPAQAFHRTGGFDEGEAAQFSQFSDFFQSLFGGSPPGGGRRGGFGRSAYHERGDDIHYIIAVSLEESYHGGERQFKLQAPTFNEHGDMASGIRTISVKIPKGVIQGTKIRLRGQGQPGANAESNGDLYLEVELAPHHRYRVDGRDLSLEVPIAPWEAVLGAQVAVPTLGGTVTATIPAGAQQGQKLRLKGRGLPGDPPGDQYLILSLAVPPSASDKAKTMYRELAKESVFNPRAKLGV